MRRNSAGLMWVLSGSREEMLAAIAANYGEKAVLLKTKPSKKIFLRLLERTAVKKILMGAGIAKTVPDSVRAGLRNAGVEVEVVPLARGRPGKYGAEVRKGIASAVKGGMPLAAALEKFGVSRRSYFYWKKKKN